MNEKSGLSEKWKRKLASDGVQIDPDQVDIRVSRNAVRSQSRLANHRNSSQHIASSMGTGHTAVGNLTFGREGKNEPEAEFSETAQEMKIRKAAEKRARRGMQ